MYLLYVLYARVSKTVFKMETRANNSAASKQQSFCVCHSLSSFSAAVPLIVEGSKRGPTRASAERNNDIHYVV